MEESTVKSMFSLSKCIKGKKLVDRIMILKRRTRLGWARLVEIKFKKSSVFPSTVSSYGR